MQRFICTFPERYPGGTRLSEMSWYLREAETPADAARLLRREGWLDSPASKIDVYAEKPGSIVYEFVATL